MEHLLIGICGGTGSGKTTLARKIADELGENSVLISMDSYYKDNSALTYEQRCQINYDHPDSIDASLMISHLDCLRAGKAVDCPIYDFTTYLRRPETKRIESAPVIIADGILLFSYPELRQRLDVKIFVDTDADERILRRIMRDVNQRGRSLDSVVTQYLTTVKPMHESFIEPSKRFADIIVPQGGNNPIAYRMILGMISQHM